MRRSLIIDQRVDVITAASLAVAAAAIVAFVACGGSESRTTEDTVSSAGVVGTAVSKLEPVPAPLPPSFAEGEAAFSERRYAEAVELFGRYVESHQDNAWGHYMLGLSSWKSGDLARAESSFVRSLELDPTHVKSLFNLTRVLLDAGRPREARERITAALAIDSTSGEGYRLLGRVRSAMNQPNEAITAYRLALSLKPEDVWSMNNMGLLLVQQQRYEEAIGPLARAVQIDSTVAVFHNNLAIALEHTGHYALATESYQRALAVDSGYTKALLSLARVNGRKEDPAVVPVDLAVMADAFDKEVRSKVVVRRDPNF
jgi:tetratricopeptide (TPR) repeat protein